MAVLCLYCGCVIMSQTQVSASEKIKKILLNSAKSVFLFSVTSWYNEGAPRPRHGPKSAHFHCYQQGGPLYTLHCGTHCKTVGAHPETTRLQQGPHGHKQQRWCCRSSAAVCPVTQVGLLYPTLTFLKTFKITCPDHDYIPYLTASRLFSPYRVCPEKAWTSWRSSSMSSLLSATVKSRRSSCSSWPSFR